MHQIQCCFFFSHDAHSRREITINKKKLQNWITYLFIKKSCVFFVHSFWFHFPNENLMFAKIKFANKTSNILQKKVVAELCDGRKKLHIKKTQTKWERKKWVRKKKKKKKWQNCRWKKRERAKEKKWENKIMQMRFLCGAYAFCILHFGMYSAYTANNCHIKMAPGIFIFFSLLATPSKRSKKKNTKFFTVCTRKNYLSKDFSLLCIIANVLFIQCFTFYFLGCASELEFTHYLKPTGLFSVWNKYFIRI